MFQRITTILAGIGNRTRRPQIDAVPIVMATWDSKTESEIPGTGFNTSPLTVVRADRELSWVREHIEASIDALDEWNGDVLDAMLDERRRQRDQSIHDQRITWHQQATDAQAQTDQAYVEAARHTQDARDRVAHLQGLVNLYTQQLAGTASTPDAGVTPAASRPLATPLTLPDLTSPHAVKPASTATTARFTAHPANLSAADRAS